MDPKKLTGGTPPSTGVPSNGQTKGAEPPAGVLAEAPASAPGESAVVPPPPAAPTVDEGTALAHQAARFGADFDIQLQRDLYPIALRSLQGDMDARGELHHLAEGTGEFASTARIIISFEDDLRTIISASTPEEFQRRVTPFVQQMIARSARVLMNGDDNFRAVQRECSDILHGPISFLEEVAYERYKTDPSLAARQLRHDVFGPVGLALSLVLNARDVAKARRSFVEPMAPDPSSRNLRDRAVLAMFSAWWQAAAAEMTVDVEIPGALQFAEGVDVGEFDLILGELATNAVKYRDQTGRPQRLFVGWDPAMGAFIVEDNGSGIADVARVWEDGFREAERHPGVPGTGTGLWSLRQRIEALGWSIIVESEVDVGTRFIITPAVGDVIGANGAVVPDAMHGALMRVSELELEIERAGEAVYHRLQGVPLARALYDEAVAPFIGRIDAAVEEMGRIRAPLEEGGRQAGWGGPLFEHISRTWHDLIGQWNGVKATVQGWATHFIGHGMVHAYDPSVLLPARTFGQVVHRMVEMERPSGVVLSEEWSPAEFATIELDRGRRIDLENLLHNLITNAVKYANPALPVHQRWVGVSVARVGDAAVIEVADNGRGMSAEALAHYGEYGWRDQAVVAEEIPGSGNGANSGMRIVGYLGGSLQVHSVLGEGTTVRVTIPIRNIVRKPGPQGSPGGSGGGGGGMSASFGGLVEISGSAAAEGGGQQALEIAPDSSIIPGALEAFDAQPALPFAFPASPSPIAIP